MSNGFKPPGGGSLTTEEKDAVDSIIQAPDDKLLLARSGVLMPSTAFQFEDDSIINNDGSFEAPPTSSYLIGNAWSLDSAGTSLGTRNLSKSKRYRLVSNEIGKSQNPMMIQERNPVEFIAQPVDTGIVTNPDYSSIIPVADPSNPEDGQNLLSVKFKLDPSSVTDNIVVAFTIDGTVFGGETLDLIPLGGNVYNAVYKFPIDIEVGDLISATITSPDGDVVTLGDSTTGVPYLEPTVTLWNFKEVAFKNQGIVPVYKNKDSINLAISGAETISADGTAGAFTLTVDVNEVDSFSVFDFAGNWNNNSRKITVSLSNGDSYELTKSNRIYFFYEDEGGIWQWYYESRKAG